MKIDEALVRSWLGALAPPERISPVDFAESEIKLPGSANAIPGPLRLAPYQRELVDSIAADDCEVVVMMLSSQTGKSISIDSQLGYCIACEPGPMLHVSPTGQRGEEFVRDRFDPLIATSPALRALIGKGQATSNGRSGGVNSIAAKTFPGGQLNFASSHKPDELAARAIKFAYLDEVDRFALSAGTEGDPVALALKRTKTFEGKGRKVVIVSTPTRRASRINQWFLRGDQRRFMVACPDCDYRAPLSFENLKWDEGKPQTAHLVCEECGCAHDEAKKRAMVEGGSWEATAQGEPGIRSYHLNELASIFSTLEAVAAAFEAAKTPEQKQVFYNTSLAQTYDAGMEVELDASALSQRAEPIVAPFPADIAFITAGVDVQGDRLECSFLGHHVDETYTVLNHLKLMGDTSASAVWKTMDSALDTVFQLADGRRLHVAATAVDTGWSKDRALDFVAYRRAKHFVTAPIKGMRGFDRQLLTYGAKARGQTRLLILASSVAKNIVQKRLTLETPGPGYIRLPNHLPPEYFEGLASEELRTKVTKGVPEYYYERTVKKNEPLDCLAYATAIAGLVKTKPAPQASKPADETDIKKLAARLQATTQNAA